MKNTALKALAASLRVIGDEMLTIAEALGAGPAESSAQQQAPTSAQAPAYQQQAAAPAYQQQASTSAQAPTYQQQAAAPAYQQQAPTSAQAPAYQQQAPAPAAAQPGGQAQIGGMEAPTAPAAPATGDEFTAFSNELINLGRQAGPAGLTPIMNSMLQRYGQPPTNDLTTVPATAYGAFIEEVRAFVAQQQGGGRQ